MPRLVPLAPKHKAGRSNKEIGGPLGITERTVKAHVSKLMCKVSAKSNRAVGSRDHKFSRIRSNEAVTGCPPLFCFGSQDGPHTWQLECPAGS